MARFVMVAQSAARPGQDEAYNQWYDAFHFPEICALPGVTGGRRFDAALMPMGAPGQPCLAIYEIDCEDAGSFMAELGRRMASGEMTPAPDALDPASAAIWFYRQRETP
ncbi:MAG TPA: hypothetical protein PKD92_13610 [Novosphingobium sp.]|nr:hypothetical protein [Novosphingobium sp.]HMP57588.1 hypothetical protein [Novosphingobium sp.]